MASAAEQHLQEKLPQPPAALLGQPTFAPDNTAAPTRAELVEYAGQIE